MASVIILVLGLVQDASKGLIRRQVVLSVCHLVIGLHIDRDALFPHSSLNPSANTSLGPENMWTNLTLLFVLYSPEFLDACSTSRILPGNSASVPWPLVTAVDELDAVSLILSHPQRQGNQNQT